MFLVATPTGFEPAISGLTGQYVKTATPRGHANKTKKYVRELYLVISHSVNIIQIQSTTKSVNNHIEFQ